MLQVLPGKKNVWNKGHDVSGSVASILNVRFFQNVNPEFNSVIQKE